jgi:RNA recognition motif-containing protein
MIRNMPFSVTEDQLHETFSKFGEVLRVKVPFGPDGRPRGFGFVDFSDASAAEAALSLDQSDLDGRAITVQMAAPREV